MKLEKGMSFEVVEWLANELPYYEIESKGFQSVVESCISDRDFYMFSRSKGNFIHASLNEIKPIGRLIIKEVK